MKNQKFQLFIVITLLSTTLGFSQRSFNFSGLEYYNNYLYNPAWIQADSLLQFDVIGQTNKIKPDYNSGSLLLNSIVSFDKINSNVQLLFERGSVNSQSLTSSIKEVSNNVEIGYSYLYDENPVKLSFGAAFKVNSIASDYSNNEDFVDYNIEYYWFNIGMGLQYKKLHFGLSYAEVIKDELPDIENIHVLRLERKFTFDSRYKFDLTDTWSLSPNLILDFTKYRNEPLRKYYYAGLLTDYKDIVGGGFSFGDCISTFAYVKLYKKVTFYMVLYSNKYEYQYPNEKGWNLTGQIRINF